MTAALPSRLFLDGKPATGFDAEDLVALNTTPCPECNAPAYTAIVWTFTHGRRRRLRVLDIDALRAKDKYVELHMSDNSMHLFEGSVSQLMRDFPFQWTTVNRGCAIRWSLVTGTDIKQGATWVTFRGRCWQVSRRMIGKVAALRQAEWR